MRRRRICSDNLIMEFVLESEGMVRTIHARWKPTWNGTLIWNAWTQKWREAEVGELLTARPMTHPDILQVQITRGMCWVEEGERQRYKGSDYVLARAEPYDGADAQLIRAAHDGRCDHSSASVMGHTRDIRKNSTSCFDARGPQCRADGCRLTKATFKELCAGNVIEGLLLLSVAERRAKDGTCRRMDLYDWCHVGGRAVTLVDHCWCSYNAAPQLVFPEYWNDPR